MALVFPRCQNQACLRDWHHFNHSVALRGSRVMFPPAGPPPPRPHAPGPLPPLALRAPQTPLPPIQRSAWSYISTADNLRNPAPTPLRSPWHGRGPPAPLTKGMGKMLTLVPHPDYPVPSPGTPELEPESSSSSSSEEECRSHSRSPRRPSVVRTQEPWTSSSSSSSSESD